MAPKIGKPIKPPKNPAASAKAGWREGWLRIDSHHVTVQRPRSFGR